MTQGHHERLDGEEVRAGSPRGFGLVFTAVFLIVGLWPLVGGGSPRWWALAIAGAFGLATAVRPAILQPLNRLWFRFGLLLSKVVNPLVLGLLFYVTVTPIGLIMRAFGKDPLRRKRTPAASYWVARRPPGPPADTMNRVF
jgi:hypothetical protein